MTDVSDGTKILQSPLFTRVLDSEYLTQWLWECIYQMDSIEDNYIGKKLFGLVTSNVQTVLSLSFECVSVSGDYSLQLPAV